MSVPVSALQLPWTSSRIHSSLRAGYHFPSERLRRWSRSLVVGTRPALQEGTEAETRHPGPLDPARTGCRDRPCVSPPV